MSDAWRPAGGEPGPPTFEVPLTGPAGPPDVVGEPPPPTDWRRVIAIGTAGGVALGIALAIGVALSGDDAGDPDDAQTTTTAPAPVSTGALIPAPETAPPTPPPTEPSSFTVTTVENRLPEYPAFFADPVNPIGTFDLATAVDELALALPRRATTTLEVGRGGYRLEVAVAYDPQTDRYRVSITGTSAPATELVVDAAGGTTYVSADGTLVVSVPNDDELFGGQDAPTFASHLLVGPVRPDTIERADVVPGGFVLIGPRSMIARRYDVTLTAADVPEWARYQFGPTDAPPPGPTDPVTFATYVSADDRIVQVDSVLAYGATYQVTAHSLERPAPGETAAIELPTERPGRPAPEHAGYNATYPQAVPTPNRSLLQDEQAT